MIDAFAEFDLPRRPWLDPELVRNRYHERSVLRHPDKCGGNPQPLARLNEARGILASHSSRLRHLRDLMASPKADQKCFQPDFELFSLVGSLAERAGRLSSPNPHTQSPLTDAVLRSEAAALEKEIARALDQIQSRVVAQEKILRDFDDRWPDVPVEDLDPLADEFSFLTKWQQSLREAKVRLLGG